MIKKMFILIEYVIQLYHKISNYVIGWFDYLKSSETLSYFTNHKYIYKLLFVGAGFFLGVFGLILPFFCPYFSFYQDNVYIYNFISYTLIIILLYKILYSTYSLHQSFLSFIYFYLNVIIITFMLWAILNIIHGLPHPIYVKDLSKSTLIRYFLFILITVLGIILFWSFKISKKPLLDKLYLKIIFPYLLEEIVKILRVFEFNVFGPLFEWLLNKLYISKLKKFLFFTLHFIFCYVIALIQAILFFNFALFYGDLRLVLYCMPLSLIAFIFKVFWYYFNTFVNSNSNDILQVINVTYKDTTVFNTDKNFILIDKNLVNIELKDITANVAYDKLLLEQYTHLFFLLGAINVSISRYMSQTKYLSYIIFSLRFSSWCYIVFPLFYYSLKDSSLLYPLFPLSSTSHLIMVQVRPYVTESYFIKKTHQKALEKLSKGSYKSNHPVTTDVEKTNTNNEVPFYHQTTHGEGPPNNPSKLLSKEEDLEGSSRTQNAVYPKEKVSFPKDWLGPSIPGSVDYHKRPDVKTNDNKNDLNYSKENKE